MRFQAEGRLDTIGVWGGVGAGTRLSQGGGSCKGLGRPTFPSLQAQDSGELTPVAWWARERKVAFTAGPLGLAPLAASPHPLGTPPRLANLRENTVSC